MQRIKKNIIELTRTTAEAYREALHLPLMVVADNIRSLHNIGSLFRTADAFDFESIALCGISGCPPHPEIAKTALGAEDSVKWSYHKDAEEAVKSLKMEGWKICVLEQVRESIPLHNFKICEGEKYAIIGGNEVDGVSQSIVDIADYILEIPQCGAKHSLNVSVSCGVAMWHFFSQYVAAGKIPLLG